MSPGPCLGYPYNATKNTPHDLFDLNYLAQFFTRHKVKRVPLSLLKFCGMCSTSEQHIHNHNILPFLRSLFMYENIITC